MSTRTSSLMIAVRGSTDALSTRDRAVLFDRSTSSDTSVREATAAVIARVRADGDAASARWRVSSMAYHSTRSRSRARSGAVRSTRWRPSCAVRSSGRWPNIRRVHEAFRPVAQEIVTADGARIGRRPDALGRVGVYAPGGRATYPSSLLMGAVPARVAGVRDVIVCSPPGPSGAPSEVLVAAAALAEVDRVFAIGGAGAIAALAYGTTSVPMVDRIVGPGNAYVAEAKVQVSSVVAIDSPAGPSELLILADAGASPSVLARELLAQAEHDPKAAVVLVSDAPALLDAVAGELAARVDAEPRAAVIREALATRGALLHAPTIDAAVAFSNAWAPEHLLLVVDARARSRHARRAAQRRHGVRG